jgi:hypothetical protein
VVSLKYRPLKVLANRPRHSLMMGQVRPQVQYGRFTDEVKQLLFQGSEQLYLLHYRRFKHSPPTAFLNQDPQRFTTRSYTSLNKLTQVVTPSIPNREDPISNLRRHTEYNYLCFFVLCYNA